MHQFLNDPADIEWLNSTALKGVTLPTIFKDFQSFEIIGNEDSPEEVKLYQDKDPLYTDTYYRVQFIRDGLFYCTHEFIKGKS
jgi:hypothetical protein